MRHFSAQKELILGAITAGVLALAMAAAKADDCLYDGALGVPSFGEGT